MKKKGINRKETLNPSSNMFWHLPNHSRPVAYVRVAPTGLTTFLCGTVSGRKGGRRPRHGHAVCVRHRRQLASISIPQRAQRQLDDFHPRSPHDVGRRRRRWLLGFAARRRWKCGTAATGVWPTAHTIVFWTFSVTWAVLNDFLQTHLVLHPWC